MHAIRTRDHRMVDPDESAERWWLPYPITLSIVPPCSPMGCRVVERHLEMAQPTKNIWSRL